MKRFARNRPGVFLAGALGAGFVIGRLIKAVDLGEVVKGSNGSTGSPGGSVEPPLGGWDDRERTLPSAESSAGSYDGSATTSGSTGDEYRTRRPATRVRPVAPVASTPPSVSTLSPVADHRVPVVGAGRAGPGRVGPAMSECRPPGTPTPRDRRPGDPDRSARTPRGRPLVGELLSRLSQDFGDLVSTQVELAKIEIKEEVTRAAKGTGLLGGGAVAGLMGCCCCRMALAWGLAEVMDAGFAFLIVGLIWVAVAAVLALRGRQQLRATTPVIPQTKETLKEDVEWAKQQRN